MAKRMSIMLIIAAIVFGGAVAWYFVKEAMIAKFLSNMKYPPATVTVTKVSAKDWQPYYESVGTLVAPQNVNINTSVAGIVKKIYFKSGDMVRKGQLLLALRDNSERAALASDLSTYRLAIITYRRDQQLYKRHAVATQTLDSAYASLKQSEAAVQGDRVSLADKNIRAPFTGKIGLRKVSLGQYISAGSGNGADIATMEQVDPLFVDFQLAQQYVHDLKIKQRIVVTLDSLTKKTYQGEISALAVGVDKDSRMITVRATIPNKKHELYSGMFVNVKVLLPTHRSAIVVPQTAITYNLYGDLVYVVKGGRAIQTFVTLGQRRGDNVEVTKGLKVGEQIVTAGQLKLFNDAPVNISKPVAANAPKAVSTKKVGAR